MECRQMEYGFPCCDRYEKMSAEIERLNKLVAAKDAKIAGWQAVYEQCDASRDRLIDQLGQIRAALDKPCV